MIPASPQLAIQWHCMLLSLRWTPGFCLCVRSLYSSQYVAELNPAQQAAAQLHSPPALQHLPSTALVPPAPHAANICMILPSGPMVENGGKSGHAAVRLPV